MFVNTALGVDVPRLHGFLEFLINPRVGVELLHEAADVDAGLLGSEGHLLVGMSETDKLCHIRHPTQLVAQIIEYHSHVPAPGWTDDLLHQALTVSHTSLLQDSPALAIFQLGDAEQPSSVAALKPIEFELDTLLLVESRCQGSHGADMSHTPGYWSVVGEESPESENVHLSLPHTAGRVLLSTIEHNINTFSIYIQTKLCDRIEPV